MAAERRLDPVVRATEQTPSTINDDGRRPKTSSPSMIDVARLKCFLITPYCSQSTAEHKFFLVEKGSHRVLPKATPLI